jgi:hypothetical protein
MSYDNNKHWPDLKLPSLENEDISAYLLSYKTFLEISRKEFEAAFCIFEIGPLVSS